MDQKIYEAGFAPGTDITEAFADFVAIVRQLRRDCPWDREQTHSSIKELLIEEAYETVEAIENDDPTELSRELGDLLLHVVFNAVIAEQEDTFNILDVIHLEIDKLVGRHPHVFGETTVSDTSEVLKNWEEIKMQEGGRSSVLDGVPNSLPALLGAQRVQEKAAGVGFDFATADDAWEKVQEELKEFSVEAQTSSNRRANEFGDLLFSLVNYGRLLGLNAEDSLRKTRKKFVTRFQYIEKRLREEGLLLEDVDLAEMDKLWEESKLTKTNTRAQDSP